MIELWASIEGATGKQVHVFLIGLDYPTVHLEGVLDGNFGGEYDGISHIIPESESQASQIISILKGAS